MCGLAAFFQPGRRFADDLLQGVSEDLYHRGPDSAGIENEAGLALVFRRLSILDPTPAADQPMRSADGVHTLIFNGEIYNYRQLRQALLDANVVLRTDGDTEAVLEGYRLWGQGVLDRLEGMYAFVLVDRRRRRALIARDPLGIKPLYAVRRGPLLAVASEMRPLLRVVPAKPDEDALAELLTFGWAAGAQSNLVGIERIPGGTAIEVPLDGGATQSRCFFDILSTLEPAEDGAEELLESVPESVEQSITAHLASDVGYTAQLSGGVDSSLVAAIAAKHAERSLVTYGVQLENAAYDEGEFRQMVVDRYNLDHKEIALTGRDFASALPDAVHHMEGPVPHGGCVMLKLLCREARTQSKVVLTGEGADEMFGGYLRYAIWRRLKWQERAARILPQGLLPPIWPFLNIRRVGRRDAAVFSPVYHDLASMHRLFPELIPSVDARRGVSRRFRDFRDRLFAVDQTAYLESLLVRQDKMSMSESVEARVPFVHLPLLKQVNRLSRHSRVPGGITKPILKRMADEYLPHDLVHRRKVGLRLPYDYWIADVNALGRYLPLLTESGCHLANYAAPGTLAAVVDAFRRGQRAGLPALFWLINVELWLRDVSKTPAPAAT